MRLRRYVRQWMKQRASAKRRGILFQLTFEEWFTWWMETGHYHERGKHREQYCMARIGDIGPYAIDNIKCQLNSDNIRDAHLGKHHSKRHRANLSASLQIVMNTPTIRAKVLKALRKPETRAKLSRSGKLAWARRKGGVL